MNTLDFGYIMEQDPCWFERYSLKCPYCNGRNSRCSKCNGREPDVVYHEAYEVDLKDDLEKARKFAWDHGFSIIDHNKKYYLVMLMCGQDFTWEVHYTRYKLQGRLDFEDVIECLNSCGYVFLDKPQRNELCRYFRRYINKKCFNRMFQMNLHNLRTVFKKLNTSLKAFKNL